MNKQLLLLLLLLSIFTLPLLAQKQTKIDKPIYEKLDFVYMKDGSYLKGQIISETDELLTFSMMGDNQVVIRKDLIKKIVPGRQGQYYLHQGHSVKKEGYYATLDFSTSWSKSRWQLADLTGAHWHFSFGKMLNDIFAVGGGIGINLYAGANWRTYTFIPLYAEVRGYHFKKRISPYYTLGLGFGFAKDLVGNFNSIEDYESGLFIKPALGFRIATRKKTNYYVEMGYRFQKTTSYYQESRWIPSTGDFTIDDVVEKITFRRLTFTTGMLF